MVRGLMMDEEWAFFEPFLVATGAKRGRPPSDHRRVLDGVFWIARTGVPWRDLHDYFGPWTRPYRQFRRWTLAGVWELMLEAQSESGAVADSLQIVDSTIIRAHLKAAGARGGTQKQGFGRSKEASRPRYSFAPTPKTCP